MSKYVFVSGGRNDGTRISLAHRDITYNMKLAKRKNDKVMYVKMLRLRAHVNNAQRINSIADEPVVTMRLEHWKNGKKYVIRHAGQFKAVISI